MRYLNSNLAREMGRLADWSDGIWSRRYQAIVVSEEEAQIASLKYILGPRRQGGIDRATPGLARPPLPPEPWRKANRSGVLVQPDPGVCRPATRRKFDRLQYATRETVILSPLPCWKHLSADAWRERVLSRSTRSKPKPPPGEPRPAPASGGSGDPGPASAPSPPAPEEIPRTLVPRDRQTVRQGLYEGYAWFVAAFRQAAEKLKAGDRSAAFPAGSFPPALPFVGG